MAKIIIGIHGLGNKPDAQLLQKWWLQSINEGLKQKTPVADIPFKLVYWADILNPLPESLDIKDKENSLFISEPYIPAESVITEKPDLQKLSSKILKYIEQQLDNIFLRKDMTLNFNSVTDRIIHSYFKDLEVYYSDDSIDKNNPTILARDVIRKRLLDVLKQHYEDDILLISHSMGSIIAYDVLITYRPECKIDTFVTVGSPLGIPVIISRIFKEQKALGVPLNISKKWYNLSDPEDLVAMDHTLEDDFRDNKNNIVIQDILVYNDYKVRGERNPHKIYGYLRTPEMAQIISDFLCEERKGFSKHYYNMIGKVKNLWEKTIHWRKDES